MPVNAQGTVALRIQCDGDALNAHITINGKYQGQCPMDIHVPAGNIEINAIKPEGELRERRFDTKFFLASGGRRVAVELGASGLNALGLQKQKQQEAIEQAKRAEAEAIRRAQQEELKKKMEAVTGDYTRDSNKHLRLRVQVPCDVISDSVESPIISPDGSLVAFTSCIAGQKPFQTAMLWEIWDIGSRKRLASLSRSGSENPIFSPDSKHFFLPIDKSTWKVSNHELWHWSVEKPDSAVQISNYSPIFSRKEPGWTASIAISPGSRYAVAFTEIRELTVWDLQNNLQKVRTISAPAFHEDAGSSRKLFVNDEGEIYLLSSASGWPRSDVLHLSKPSETEFKAIATLGELTSFQISIQDGVAFGVSARRDGRLAVIDPSTGKEIFGFQGRSADLKLDNARLNGLRTPIGIWFDRGNTLIRLSLEGGVPKMRATTEGFTCQQEEGYSIPHRWKDFLYCLGPTQVRKIKHINGRNESAVLLQLTPDLPAGRRIRAARLTVNDTESPRVLSFVRQENTQGNDGVLRTTNAIEVWSLEGTDYFHMQ